MNFEDFLALMLRDEVADETGGSDAGGGAGAVDPAPAAGETQVTPAEFQAEEGEEQTGDEPPPAAYTPNLKFKVLDQEKEMDEWLRPLLTDPENEKKVRDLLERAHGLDHVKASRQQIQGAYEQLGQQHGQLVSRIEDLSGMVRTGDMESFFEALQIPEEMVLKYALTRIQYRQADPEQRQAYDQWRQTQQQVRQLQQQNGQFQTDLQQRSTEGRNRELDIAVARPEVSTIAQAYDARVGKPGAFKEEVINRGRFHWLANQKDIGVDEAIKEVLTIVGGTPQAAQNSQQFPATAGQPGTPQTTAPQVAPKAPEKKPVIPSFNGNGTSPAKVVPRSIAQLRQMGQELAASENR